MVNKTTLEMFNTSFSWYDYTFFGLVLSISVAIGIYFGIFKKQSSENEYLLGGKQMSTLPVAISMIASSISGITLLAVPADAYRYGIGYWLCCPVQIWVTVIMYFVYLPVFYKLEITSIYEYLRIRFNSKVQIFASILFVISSILYLPVVIYIPALGFSQATGVSIHVITPVICGICIFYTTIGGLKTVVWTDTLQFVVMIFAVIAVFSMGIISTGGFEAIWSTAEQYGRLHVSMEVDVTKRETIWSAFIGMTFMWFRDIPLNQEHVQKCLSLPNYRDVKRSLTIYAIGKVTLISFCVFTGLIMFARYAHCDPLTSGQIDRTDQLLPYYILDVAKSIPGLSGLFMAGIFSAALSTLSAQINCLSGTIYKDFMAPFVSKKISQEKVSSILKWLTLIVGVINTGLVFVVEQLGSLLALTFSLGGVTSGPLIGLFIAGMLIPMVNSNGALCGGIISLVTMLWIVTGRQWYENQGILQYPTLPLYTDACKNSTNWTVTHLQPQHYTNNEDIFFLYRVSFYWYSLIGILIVLMVSIAVSIFTPEKNKTFPKEYFSPVIHFLLPNDKSRPPQYHTIEHALSTFKKEEN